MFMRLSMLFFCSIACFSYAGDVKNEEIKKKWVNVEVKDDHNRKKRILSVPVPNKKTITFGDIAQYIENGYNRPVWVLCSLLRYDNQSQVLLKDHYVDFNQEPNEIGLHALVRNETPSNR